MGVTYWYIMMEGGAIEQAAKCKVIKIMLLVNSILLPHAFTYYRGYFDIHEDSHLTKNTQNY